MRQASNTEARSEVALVRDKHHINQSVEQSGELEAELRGGARGGARIEAHFPEMQDDAGGWSCPRHN